MTFKATMAALGSVAAIALPNIGHATTIIFTYQGYVRDGYDLAGLFGPGPTDLANELYTAVVTIDDTKGTSVYTPPIGSEISGAPASGTLSPVSAVITMRGVSQAIVGNHFGDASQTDTPDLNIMWQEVSDADATSYSLLQIFLMSDVNDFLSSYDYHFPTPRVPHPGDSAAGSLTFLKDSKTIVSADLTVRSLTIAGMPADVPEPATWAMMIMGFGLAGATLRARRALTT